MSLLGRFYKAKERQWMVLTPILYVMLWIICGYEIRYALFAEVAEANVTEREEWIDEERNGRKFIRLHYTFQDVSTGVMRKNSEVEIAGIIDTHDDPKIVVQYLPGVDGESRRYSKFNEYFMIIFLGGNLLAALLLWWGYSMFKSDTWASNPGKRL